MSEKEIIELVASIEAVKDFTMEDFIQKNWAKLALLKRKWTKWTNSFLHNFPVRNMVF